MFNSVLERWHGKKISTPERRAYKITRDTLLTIINSFNIKWYSCRHDFKANFYYQTLSAKKLLDKFPPCYLNLLEDTQILEALNERCGFPVLGSVAQHMDQSDVLSWIVRHGMLEYQTALDDDITANANDLYLGGSNKSYYRHDIRAQNAILAATCAAANDDSRLEDFVWLLDSLSVHSLFDKHFCIDLECWVDIYVQALANYCKSDILFDTRTSSIPFRQSLIAYLEKLVQAGDSNIIRSSNTRIQNALCDIVGFLICFVPFTTAEIHHLLNVTSQWLTNMAKRIEWRGYDEGLRYVTVISAFAATHNLSKQDATRVIKLAAGAAEHQVDDSALNLYECPLITLCKRSDLHETAQSQLATIPLAHLYLVASPSTISASVLKSIELQLRDSSFVVRQQFPKHAFVDATIRRKRRHTATLRLLSERQQSKSWASPLEPSFQSLLTNKHSTRGDTGSDRVFIRNHFDRVSAHALTTGQDAF